MNSFPGEDPAYARGPLSRQRVPFAFRQPGPSFRPVRGNRERNPGRAVHSCQTRRVTTMIDRSFLAFASAGDQDSPKAPTGSRADDSAGFACDGKTPLAAASRAPRPVFQREDDPLSAREITSYFNGETGSAPALMALWEEIRNDRPFPLLSDIDRQALTRDIPVSFLMTPGNRRQAPVFLAWGAGLRDLGCMMSGPMTRLPLDDCPTFEEAFPPSLGDSLLDLADSVASIAHPLTRSGRDLFPGGRLVVYRALLLPVSRDGQNVTHILGGLDHHWPEQTRPARSLS